MDYQPQTALPTNDVPHQIALYVDELGNHRLVEEDEFGSIIFLDDNVPVEAQCDLENIDICDSCQ